VKQAWAATGMAWEVLPDHVHAVDLRDGLREQVKMVEREEQVETIE